MSELLGVFASEIQAMKDEYCEWYHSIFLDTYAEFKIPDQCSCCGKTNSIVEDK